MKNYFITGCDLHNEWMLPWFMKNYKKHNSLPITFANFGVSPTCLEWCNENFDGILNYSGHYIGVQKKWFLKSKVLASTHGNRVWLDTDCEVLDDISTIFDCMDQDKLNLVVDQPWTNQRGSLWYNTGVIGANNGYNTKLILQHWNNQCFNFIQTSNTSNPIFGDQDILHNIISNMDSLKRLIYINELPAEYNWLRLQIASGNDNPNKKIMHWTGPKGKEEIRRKMQ